MSPEAFVGLLATELQVAGVVVGANYRFGYRAAGTASLLESLGPQHGLQVRILDLVAGTHQASASGSSSSSSSSSSSAERAAQNAAAAQEAASATIEEQQQQPGQQPHAQPGGQQHSQPPDAVERTAAHAAASSSRVRHALAHGDMADAALCLDRPYRLVASLADDPAATMLADGAALRLPASSLCNQPPRPGRYAAMATLTGDETLQELGPARHVQLSLDETGLSLHGCGDWAGALPPGAAHVALDFL
ncbi:FAD synthetase chloroplastic-like [Chlorella sorokiniana]|uniref:FAD synthase n=1 Tax=Chlorella sorokiniana TaxID=3076 RepID=A0A2P6U5M7_CHLSO|nr:FAD synthetase chloroplastic-like [Chlorella sorokiniana]|eukprot:PRW61615.1 FAD synthetase chloroplastic-like [Chlorella sorokiniana]